jgi:hypothetical protein
MEVTDEFKTQTNILYKNLSKTIQDAALEAMPNGLEVALTALNSLAVVTAMSHGVTQESFLANVAHIFDQYSTLVKPVDNQGVH